jgi:Abi-like protein
MQLPNEPKDDQFTAIIRALHDDRIDRYLPATYGNQEDALRIYLWNCALCEAFYLPLHFAEIVIRNAINNHLIERLGDRWFENRTFIKILNQHYQDDLDDLLQAELLRHGDNLTCHHLVSELSFGFWQHLLTKRFSRIIWATGFKSAFPNLPNSMERQDIYNRIEIIRKWRNRIAHHKPIFDQGPSAKYHDLLQLMRWVCHDTANWISSVAKVTAAIDLRPKLN